MHIHREIIRLAFQLKLSANEIARATNVSRGTVQTCVKRASELNLGWPLPDELNDDKVLSQLLYPVKKKQFDRYFLPDFQKIHSELARKGVTLTLLWKEYKEEHPEDFYCFAHYSKLYKRWLNKKDVVMRQSHVAGEKLFVDFAGQTIPLVCRETGEVTQAQIFVATFGASNFTYVEASKSQDLRNWIGLHVRAFRYFGGVPKFLIPDNLKSAVTEAKRFDPLINRTYRRMAQHYSCGVLPARPRRPKDKAKVEKAVQTVEQWILARLRNLTFFSIHQLNKEIAALLEELNDEPDLAIIQLLQKKQSC